MSQPKLPTPPSPHITDVEQFFFEITNAYLDFERRVRKLLSALHSFSPNQIHSECTQLGQRREDLALLDAQMFAILNLAGSAIANTSMVYEYRSAFTKVSLACGDLQHQLLEIRTGLENTCILMKQPASAPARLS